MDFEAAVRDVLAALGVPEARGLGGGGEGVVYALDARRVVKVYRKATRAYLEALTELLAQVDGQGLPFATPRIEEIGEHGGTCYTIERRLSGRRWRELAARWTTEERTHALNSFFDALEPLNAITFAERAYGQVLHLDGMLTAETWPAFLAASAERCYARSVEHLRAEVSAMDAKATRFFAALERLPAAPPKRLVHGDYYLDNVLFAADGRLSAMLDFGWNSVVGDPLLDVAGAVRFLSLTPDITPGDTAYLWARAEARYGRYGTEVGPRLALYTLYYAIYFSMWVSDRTSYAWCMDQLNDEALWARVDG